MKWIYGWGQILHKYSLGIINQGKIKQKREYSKRHFTKFGTIKLGTFSAHSISSFNHQPWIPIFQMNYSMRKLTGKLSCQKFNFISTPKFKCAFQLASIFGQGIFWMLELFFSMAIGVAYF
jgi:hypothetical protein